MERQSEQRDGIPNSSDLTGLTFGNVLSALSSSSPTFSTTSSGQNESSASIIAEETLRLERRLREAEAEVAVLKNVNRLQKDRIDELENRLGIGDRCKEDEGQIFSVKSALKPTFKSLDRSSIFPVASANDVIVKGSDASAAARDTFDRDVQNYYETRCRNLEKMVMEMHRWFSDYDLVWVGDKEEKEEEDELSGMKELTEEEDEEYRVRNADLNLDSLIAAFPDGDVEENEVDDDEDSAPMLDLFWFANGLKISSYPLMPYDDSTWGRQTLDEIAEGFLPSRLQFDFPDGVELRSKDRRGFVFEDRGAEKRHPSVREMQARGLLPSVDHPALERRKKGGAGKRNDDFTPSVFHLGSRVRPKSPASRYLDRVPRVVIDKDGDIQRPRQALEQALTGSSTANFIRRIPVRIRAYHRHDENQVLRLHLRPEQTVDDVKRFCEDKLGVERGSFDEHWELVSDEALRQHEMEKGEFESRNVLVWKADGRSVADLGWRREDVNEDAPIRDKLICLHLRCIGKGKG